MGPPAVGIPLQEKLVRCEPHGWTKKSLPCPWLRCPNGARGLWIVVGKRKKVVYVRQRDKDEHGPRYWWEKTSCDPNELLRASPEDEDDEIVF
jgi:hypothetical protein